MQVSAMYATMNYGSYGSLVNSSLSLREYVTPRRSFDPRHDIERAQEKKRPQGKFKIVTKPKVSAFDEHAKNRAAIPSPDKYHTEGKMGKRFASQQLVKREPTARKRTYIEAIQASQHKNKFPGVGKYKMVSITDFDQHHSSALKRDERKEVRRSNMDNAVCLAAKVPGPGQYNPHDIQQKLKLNPETYKETIAKHAKISQRIKKSESSKLAPNAYVPIPAEYGTFARIASNKDLFKSRWSHGTIDKRSGHRDTMVVPSPAQYSTVNQWAVLPAKNSQIGSLQLHKKIAFPRSKSVYRD